MVRLTRMICLTRLLLPGLFLGLLWSCGTDPALQCPTPCESSKARCSGLNYQECKADAKGCLVWKSVDFCEGGKVCDAARGGCAAPCSGKPKKKGCEGNAVHWFDECGKRLSQVETCVPPRYCEDGACKDQPVCKNECVEGTRKCEGDRAVRACERNAATGCLAWGAAGPCPTGQVCSGGNCSGGGCQDKCTAGQRRCNVKAVQVCEKSGATGCLDWSAPMTCPAGQSCSGGRCSGGGCTNECTAGQLRCSGNSVQICVQSGASGCYVWSTPRACPSGQSCSGGQCTGSGCTNQ